MYAFSYTRPVNHLRGTGTGIVGHPELRQSSDRDLRNKRHEVVWNSACTFADQARFVRSDRIEMTAKNNTP
jgi:hypothetical protein